MSPDLSKSRFPWSGSQKPGWRNPTRGIPRRGPPPPNSRFCNRRETASRMLRSFEHCRMAEQPTHLDKVLLVCDDVDVCIYAKNSFMNCCPNTKA